MTVISCRLHRRKRELPCRSRSAWTFALAAFLPVILLQWAAPSALADYRVHRGDVVEISVAGAASLQRRIMIDNDGKLYFPLVGELDAAGRSLAQLRQQIRDRLVSTHAFANPDVTVGVAEYRPVYVAGDVAKPGAYSYRPGMTVRDAIALAGGVGRTASSDPFDAQDRRDALLIEFARLEIHTARLRTELAGGTKLRTGGVRGNATIAPFLAEFAEMEGQQLKSDQDDFSNEKAHLARLIETTQEQVSALLAEEAQQRSALAQQQHDGARVEALLRRSLVQISRVEEERRALAAAQTQFFELKARLAQARRDLEGYARQLQKLQDRQKVDIIKQLEAATGQLATVKVHLASLGERLRDAGSSAPQSLRDGDRQQEFAIFREERGKQRRVAAEEGTNLLPGDTLEIARPRALGPQGLALGTPLSYSAAGVSGTATADRGDRAKATPPASPAASRRSEALLPPPSVLRRWRAGNERSALQRNRDFDPGSGDDFTSAR